MRPGLLPCLVLVLFVLLGLTSCGGDEPLTGSEYRAAGNQLCADWSAKIDELSLDVANGNPSEAEIVEFSTKAGAVADDYTERLMKLSPPDSLAADHARIQETLDAYDALVDGVPQTQDEVDAITNAGQAITTALGDMWSSCRR